MMICYSSIILATFLIVITSDPTNAIIRLELLKNQKCVTKPDDLEEFYWRIKSEIPFQSTYVQCDGQAEELRKEDYSGDVLYSPRVGKCIPTGNSVEEDLEDKSRICERIFNSVFFEIQNEKAVSIDFKAEETTRKLRTTNSDMYKDIYGDWPEVGNKSPNPYTKREVLIEDIEYPEKVFRCVTQKWDPDTNEHRYAGYFISSIYQSIENPMNGRFVFIPGDNDKLKIYAMAEEPPIVDRDVIQKTHRAYFDAHEQNQKTELLLDADRNPLCTLSVSDKVKFCTLVMNTTGFPYKIKYRPTVDYIESQDCVKKKVLAEGILVEAERKGGLFSKPQRKKILVEMTYDEWMLGCKAIPIGGVQNPPTFTYYVARGLDEHTAIIFKQSTEIAYLAPDFGVSELRLKFGASAMKRISLGREIELT